MCGQSRWNEDGVIIYANDPRLIGEQFARGDYRRPRAGHRGSQSAGRTATSTRVRTGCGESSLVSEDGSRTSFRSREQDTRDKMPAMLDGLRPAGFRWC